MLPINFEKNEKKFKILRIGSKTGIIYAIFLGILLLNRSLGAVRDDIFLFSVPVCAPFGCSQGRLFCDKLKSAFTP
jgi:hypothetical protein